MWEELKSKKGKLLGVGLAIIDKRQNGQSSNECYRRRERSNMYYCR